MYILNIMILISVVCCGAFFVWTWQFDDDLDRKVKLTGPRNITRDIPIAGSLRVYKFSTSSLCSSLTKAHLYFSLAMILILISLFSIRELIIRKNKTSKKRLKVAIIKFLTFIHND